MLCSCNRNLEERKEIISFFSGKIKERKIEALREINHLAIRANEQPNEFKALYENENRIYKKYIESLDSENIDEKEKRRIFDLYTSFFEETKLPRKRNFNSLDELAELDDQVIILKLKLDVFNAFLENRIFRTYSLKKIEELVNENQRILLHSYKLPDSTYVVLVENDDLSLLKRNHLSYIEDNVHLVLENLENSSGENILEKMKIEISDLRGSYNIPSNLPDDLEFCYDCMTCQYEDDFSKDKIHLVIEQNN